MIETDLVLFHDRVIEIAPADRGYQFFLCPLEGGFRLPSDVYETKEEAVTYAYQNALWGWVVNHAQPTVLVDCSCSDRGQALLGHSMSCSDADLNLDPLLLCRICQEGQLRQRLMRGRSAIEVEGEKIQLPLKTLIVATFHREQVAP